MNLKLVLYLFVIFFISSCRLTQGFQTHELTPEHIHRWSTSAESAILADLKGDGQEILITSHYEGKLGYILLSSLNGKSISQINMGGSRLLGLSTLTDPSDGSIWLFFSANNNETLSLIGAKYDWQVPLRREMKTFSRYKRDDNLIGLEAYTWAAFYKPNFLEDIDGDGKLELVCTAFDGYSSNPRGVVAFDWESGETKWFFRSPTIFNRIYLADLDGDGTKEFLLSNTAFNNNNLNLQGLTDFSGHLVVLSTKGELLHNHKVFDGLGTLVVNVADVDQDSRPDIFAIAATRGTNSDSDYLLRLSYQNGRLKREKELSLPKSFSQEANINFLQRMDSSSGYTLVITDSERGILYYDTELNEVKTRPQPQVKEIYDIGDLRKKGYKELIAVNNDSELQIFDHQLFEMARIHLPLQNRRIFSTKIIQNRLGKQPLVAIILDNTLATYSLKPISGLTLATRLFKAHAPWIALFLLILLILTFLLLFRNRQDFIGIMNQLQEGLIMIRGKDRIELANKAALDMAIEHEPNSSLKSLREVFPELSRMLVGMRRARLLQEDSEVEVSGKNTRVHIREIRSWCNRSMIFIYPKQEVMDSDTVQWAEIARRLSHHVRRHITNVILALDPLDDGANPAAAEYIDIIKSEIEKVRVFTHAFQRFTEMHNYDLKLQDLIPSVEHALGGIRKPDNVKIIRNYGLKSIHAKIEPIRFEEAIVNTINNATEAMPTGGSLHISIREFPQHKSPRGNLSVLVEIEDSGKGIPAKYMEDIWKPFFTTNQSGTGIGIPETRKIIDSMGGIMDIQSEEGVGTTVSFWLKGEHDE
jgi:signal transduction histidine kinase